MILSFLLLMASVQMSFAQVKGNVQQMRSYNNEISIDQLIDAPSGYQQAQSTTSNRFNVPQAYISNDHTVYLDAKILMNVEADKYVAIFNLIQLGETAQQADELMHKRINGFTADLADLGIPVENVSIDMLSLLPVFEREMEKKLFSKNYNEVPKGFELQKNIHVLFDKSEVMDKIITIGAKHEIYELVLVNYYVEDVEAVQDSLRNEAIRLINKKAKAFEGLGLALSEEYHIVAEKGGIALPGERYADYQAFSSSSVEAIKRKTGVKEAKKTTVYYYDPVTAAGYDKVINPVIAKPVVQYAYNLRVKYLIKPPKEEVKQEKEYWIITPNGDLKPVNLK